MSVIDEEDKIDSLIELDGEGFVSNGLKIEGAPFGLEKIYDYDPGGHHPVHLNDKLGKRGRYKVIHKLGSGGFANVWLCRDLGCDSPKYVGVKILIAWASKEDCPELHVNRLIKLKVGQEVGGKHICLPWISFISMARMEITFTSSTLFWDREFHAS
jgi:serine/threonine-protein kinase SRPK3